MAFTLYPNERIYGVSWLFYRLKELLLTGGWTVPASSDGTTYSSTGDAISCGTKFTSSVATPGSLSNANAWFRLRHPLGTCEILIQHSASNTQDNWKIRYSKLGFSGGSPSATVAPTATDEIYIYGSAASFQSFEGSFSIYNIQVTNFWIGDASEDYSWFLTTVSGGSPDLGTAMLVFDRLSNVASGDDPTIFGIAGTTLLTGLFNASVATGTFTPQTSSPRFWGFMSKYSATETQMVAHSLAWVAMNAMTTGTPLAVGTSPYDNNVDMYLTRLSWMRQGYFTQMPSGVMIPQRSPIKGRSRIFKGYSGAPLYRRTAVLGGNTYLVLNGGSATLNSNHYWLLPWQAGVDPRW